MGSPACNFEYYTSWVTTRVPNGAYEIRAQHSCSCTLACPEVFERIRVTVANP